MMPVDTPDCAAVRAAIQQGRLDAPEVKAHAAQCEGCAELLASPELAHMLGNQGEEDALSDALASAIARQVASEPPPSGRLPRLIGVPLGLCGAALALGLMRARPDLSAIPVDQAALLLGAFGLSAAAGVWWVARPPWQPPLSSGQQTGAIAALLALPLLTLVLPLADPMGVGALSVPTLLCLGYGSVMVVLSVGLMGATFRHDTLLGARWPLAAAIGAVLGNGSLLIHCPASDAGHVLVGHVGLGLLAVAAGALGSSLGVTPAGAAR